MAEASEIIPLAENIAAISKKEEGLQNGIIKTPETSGLENGHVKEVSETAKVEESEPVNVSAESTNTEGESKNIGEASEKENKTKIEEVAVKDEKETSTQIETVEEDETKLEPVVVKDDEIKIIKEEVKEYESTSIIINEIKENHTILEGNGSTKNTEVLTISDQHIIKNSTVLAVEDEPPTRTPSKKAVHMVRWEKTKSILFILFLILFIIWVGLFVAKYYYFTDIKL